MPNPPSHRFVIADVFTETAFGGNQLAVFPDARGLSDRAMRALAREFNFAETTFVLPPEDTRHARRVRIFTPKAKLPFAGHPTVGTAAVLAELGLVAMSGGAAAIVLGEGIGPVAVDIRLGGTTTFARFCLEQDVESPTHRPERQAVAAALALPEGAVIETWFAGIGVRFAFIRLANQGAVDRAVLDRAAWSEHFARAWAPNLYLFAGGIEPGSRLYVRMFAPALGIEEDPATGSGAAILAGCLAARLSKSNGEFAWRIEQGAAIGRPSVIEVQAEKRGGRIVRIWVGGFTVVVGEGTLTVPAGY
ncbi:MAG: PhzF family phenazine biosynthesis protein [Rhodospirillales bacterium]|nr:PhzF family phenazine biosynthesis protein [Rhodospirillales bacterium]